MRPSNEEVGIVLVLLGSVLYDVIVGIALEIVEVDVGIVIGL